MASTEEIGDTGAAEVRAELERILSSEDFDASRRSHAFLQFVVDRTLNHTEQSISQYAIATEVFGRGPDFDPTNDPIVRIQAGRLRRSLEHYYLTTGASSPLRIVIPKGSYVPTFQRVDLPAEPGPLAPVSKAQKQGQEWPVVFFLPLGNLTGDTRHDYLARGLTSELVDELSRYQDIRVIPDYIGTLNGNGTPSPCDAAAEGMPCFVVEGNVMRDSLLTRISVRLLDCTTRYVLWFNTYRAATDGLNEIGFQERAAQSIAAQIADEQGILMRAMAKEVVTRPPRELKTYEALLRYYDYETTYSAQAFVDTLAALTHAVEIEPKCGLAWAMLGRIYGTGYGLDILNEADALEKAIEFARRGVSLLPNNQRARLIWAYSLLLADELDAAKEEVQKALDLNPKSLYLLDGIAYLLTLLGDWERGPRLINEAIRANPCHRPIVCQALWYDYFRRGEYEAAYHATQRVHLPTLFWAPLTEAAALGQLGKVDEARAAANRILVLRPDFGSRGRELIRRYIKFDEILERIVAGLEKAGLTLD